MLLKIREKSQGAFAWLILVIICVPFALWGIQNYMGGASENAIAVVGDKEFLQSDINQAYQQYSQNFQGMTIDEEILKRQSLQKLIKDEVLLQHVQDEDLVVTDADARKFIAALEYFQVDGKFDKKQYKAVLNSQRMSSIQFESRIKKAQIMEQYQRAITDSSFATQYDLEHFFKIQNQQRDIQYITLPLESVDEVISDAEIDVYYQKNQANYQTIEQVSIEYLSLSLDDLAQKISVTDEQLQDFYLEQKESYSTKERRKISHILFAFNKDVDEDLMLTKAKNAREDLKQKTFSILAAEISDDKATAKQGGDLGLFEVGVMEKDFELAASKLGLNEVSEPVKSAYGYHLITVTELVASETKPFAEVKTELIQSYQRQQAENDFYETSERLAEISYETPDSLAVASDAIGVTTLTTELFTRNAGVGVAKEDKVREYAFTEEVLQGNNSDLIEISDNKVIVLRVLEHKPASTRALIEVKQEIIKTLLVEKSYKKTLAKIQNLKTQLLTTQDLAAIAAENNLEIITYAGLKRQNKIIPWQINQAAFKAAKPVDEKVTIFTVALPAGEQNLVQLTKVVAGVMSKDDKKQQKLAVMNMSKAFSQATFNAVLNSLQTRADVMIRTDIN